MLIGSGFGSLFPRSPFLRRDVEYTMTSTIPNRFLSGLPVAIAAGIAAVVGGLPFSVNGQSEAELNLYSARHYDTDQALYDEFTEQTGIEVNLIEGDADELIERIKSEGDNSPADVLCTVDAGRLWRADQEGLFAPTSSEVLEEAIPENLRHPDGHWFGFSKRARVIMYHKDRVDPADISTYAELADPQWQGKVLIRSSSNIYNQSLVASLIENLGVEETEAWATGVVENMARPPQGGDTDQIKALAAGEGDLAVANTYYLARLINSVAPEDQEVAEVVGVIFPNQDGRGTHVNISGCGVMANAPNAEAAVQFLEYLVTPDAQSYFADGNNEYPVVEGVSANSTVENLGEFKEDTISATVYGENNPEAVKLFDRVGWK